MDVIAIPVCISMLHNAGVAGSGHLGQSLPENWALTWTDEVVVAVWGGVVVIGCWTFLSGALAVQHSNGSLLSLVSTPVNTCPCSAMNVPVMPVTCPARSCLMVPIVESPLSVETA
ncbi:hypothetical protein Tco_1353937 [Tanacetum coccineum]